MLGNFNIKRISMLPDVSINDIQKYLFQLADEIEYNLTLIKPDVKQENDNKAEQQNTKETPDIGKWILADIPVAGNFETYSAKGANPLKYRKISNIVELRGIIKNKTDVASGDGDNKRYILNLPEGYRPDGDIYSLQQASGNGIWLLHIKKDGKVFLERHRDNSVTTKSGYSTLTAGSWLPIEISFSVEG